MNCGGGGGTVLGVEVAIESARSWGLCCCAFRNALFQQLKGRLVGIMEAIFAVMLSSIL